MNSLRTVDNLSPMLHKDSPHIFCHSWSLLCCLQDAQFLPRWRDNVRYLSSCCPVKDEISNARIAVSRNHHYKDVQALLTASVRHQTTAKNGMAVTQGPTVTSTGMIGLDVMLKDVVKDNRVSFFPFHTKRMENDNMKSSIILKDERTMLKFSAWV